MARLAPTPPTLRALFARSGNLCAYPGCTQELITNRNRFVAQVCHIEAAEPGGERYNPASNDEERRSLENLILLCYPHHTETDDVAKYPTARLREMKRSHEEKRGQKVFKINESALYQIEHEMELYWNHITKLNSDYHVAQDFAVSIRPNASPIEVFEDIRSAYVRIKNLVALTEKCDSMLNAEVREYLISLGYDLAVYDAVPRHDNPFSNRFWEIHCIAFPNSFTDLNMAINIAEIQHLQEYIKTHPSDSSASDRLAEAKTKLQEIADKIGYLD